MTEAICVSNDNKGVSAKETMDALYKAGFRHVFIQWYNKDYKEFDMDEISQVNYARSIGLTVDFVHLCYKDLNNIWLDGEFGEELTRKYLRNIDEVSSLGIDLVVMHIVNSFDVPDTSEIGLSRFKRIVEYALSKNVRIAFENTKVKGYQEYMIEHLEYPNVGICFDCGHFHCHFKDDLDFSKFKDKILCVHIHDNYGLVDDHLIPFDGTLDYNIVINGLHEANYNGNMTLELVYKGEYLNMSLDEFFDKAYKVNKKLIKMYKEN